MALYHSHCDLLAMLAMLAMLADDHNTLAINFFEHVHCIERSKCSK